MSPNRRNTNTPSHGRRGAAMFASLLSAVGSRCVQNERNAQSGTTNWCNQWGSSVVMSMVLKHSWSLLAGVLARGRVGIDCDHRPVNRRARRQANTLRASSRDPAPNHISYNHIPWTTSYVTCPFKLLVERSMLIERSICFMAVTGEK